MALNSIPIGQSSINLNTYPKFKEHLTFDGKRYQTLTKFQAHQNMSMSQIVYKNHVCQKWLSFHLRPYQSITQQ